ncbi:murein transglycosylase A [Desulfococcus sp.]|uniref:murein transglycosylase A n=1 Tax=Desulfococcus sp. TaxID=2025834 RepID=UPI003D10FBAC
MKTAARLGFGGLLLLCLLAGCAAPPPPEGPLVVLDPSSFPEFSDDMAFEGITESLSESLKYLKRVPADTAFRFGSDVYDAPHMIRSLERFQAFIAKRPDRSVLSDFIRSHYRVYRSVGGDTGRMLFTGYYEPFLQGSLSRKAGYAHPIYGPPEDLAVLDLSDFSEKLAGHKIVGRVAGKTFVPYHDRNEIDGEGVLLGKAPVLVWVADPVALFFLQIQGSGKVFLDDGDVLNIHYHSSNGRPYRSIGNLLIRENKIPQAEMSMQRIRAYLNTHPGEVERIFNYNPSYVFFSLEKDGPYGAIRAKLTPGRSIAVDRSVFPMAGIAFIQSQKPVAASKGAGGVSKWVSFSRFVSSQDTGGAIKGPGRADLFWGSGSYAETAAGHLKHPGELYFLVLKPEA